MGDLEHFCCEGCFEHFWLRGIAKEKGKLEGCCFYCGTAALLAPITVFRTGFTNLLSDYIPAEVANGGRDSYLASVPIHEAIQRDWKLFSSRCHPELLKCFLPSLFKDDLPSPLRDFQIPVVPFHRNAMSTAYDKWLQFWMIDPTAYSSWTNIDEPTDVDEIGTYGSAPA